MNVIRRFLTALSYVTWLPLARKLGTGTGLSLDNKCSGLQSDKSQSEDGSAQDGLKVAASAQELSANEPKLAASGAELAGLEKLDSDLSGLSKYLPSVGLLIGVLLLALAMACLLFFKASNIVTATILVVAWIASTGGLHFDGLMDTADGVFSHRSKERMLEIMRDPRAGNFGVLTAVSTFALKLASLASLCEHASILIPTLVLAPAWGRWSELYAIAMFPYARPEGNGKIWHDTTRAPRDLLVGAALPLLTSLLLACQFGVINTFSIIISACTVGMVASHWLAEQLGGQTGDTYGAVVEISETGCLVLMALIANQLTPSGI